jgi:alpha-ribazole phosphatase
MSEADTLQCLRLYLIRHGEVEEAAAGKLLGFTDPDLSDKGLEQARGLAETLSSAQLLAIYSSDLVRASRTAETIARPHHLLVSTLASLREIDMGEWDGRTIAAIHAQAPEKVAELFTDPSAFRYPDGESFVDFTPRVNAALQQLTTLHETGEIVVVAHGGVCRAIIGSMLEIPIRNWLRLAQDHGCINVIEWYDGNPVLRLLNQKVESGTEIRSSKTSEPSQSAKLVEGEDYYYEGAMMVFTASYHLRRGYCCNSGCRHCPYGEGVAS